jgi:phosphatidylglycerophosphatase A
MRAVVLFLASVSYLGYIPIASGTFGSLVGIPAFWAFDPLRHASTPAYLAAFAAMVLGACWLAGRAEALLREHDSHKIVIDEVVGYLAATLFLEPTWQNTIVAFFAFRAFDIVKPFPASYADKHMAGGYGVVLDDVISGLYANAATRIVMLMI